VNPYRGGAESPPYWTYGVEEALRLWAEHNGCAAPPAEERVSQNVARIRWLVCSGGSTLELYLLSDSGHTWPGSGFPFPEYLGGIEHQIDATELIVRFFENFRLTRN
jgi:polyhydroxybutyrate depolymerase